MIKNVIFDMGKVLIDFDHDYFIDQVGVENNKDRQILKRGIFGSLEWALMDRGSLTDEEASEIIKKRVPEHLKEKVELLTCHWDRYIVPIKGAKELVKELKDNGYKIYLLSNAAVNQKRYWKDIPGNEYFDGTAVSCFAHLVKSQPEIYKYLLDKFNLKANECVFIDDAPLNVEGAVFSGLHGIVFYGDYKEVRKKLIELGVNVKEK